MISKEEIRQLARLARIEVSVEEEDKFLHDLESILGYVKKLESADTADASLLLSITGSKNQMRPDAEEQVLEHKSDELIKAAPDKKDRHIRVKSVWS